MPLFFVGTLFVLSILRHEWELEGVRLYAFAGLIGAAAGVASEVMQKADAARRVLGGRVCRCRGRGVRARGACRGHPPREIEWRRARHGGADRARLHRGLPGADSHMVRAYVHRNAQFPVLASFDSRVELAWIVGYGIRRDVIAGVLEVEFVRRVFPGFSFYEPVADWRKYKTLIIDAENPELEQVLHLGVRVHDSRAQPHLRGPLQSNFRSRAGRTTQPADSARRHPSCAAQPPDEYGANLRCDAVSYQGRRLAAPAAPQHAPRMTHCR